MKEHEKMLKEQFLAMWSSPTTSYETKSTHELAELDSDTEFTGRRIAAFRFTGDWYTTSQWNEMEVKSPEAAL